MITLIVPYYRNMKMLERQIAEWSGYPQAIRIIVVDDGSPEPAEPIIRNGMNPKLAGRVELYRIAIDIPWNRGGARNLGSRMASTDWIVHIDIDHLLPAESAARLCEFVPDPKHWYRFRRFRRGQADETRKKDKIPNDQVFGEIHPHVDSYLCTRALYWKIGGYDEDYSGCLGGGSPFLRQITAAVGEPRLLPQDVCLHVFTRTEVPDASDLSLSRDKTEYSRRRRVKEQAGRTKARQPLRFAWSRVL